MNVTFSGGPTHFKDWNQSAESVLPKLRFVGILEIAGALHRWVLHWIAENISRKNPGQDCSVETSVSCFLCVSQYILKSNRYLNEAKSSHTSVIDDGPSSFQTLHVPVLSCPPTLRLLH